MSSLLLNNPYIVINDLDGNPLQDGLLYVGEANLNPVTNPIEIFSNSDLTIPLANPLTIQNGYVVGGTNSNPTRIYISNSFEAFSMASYNKKNELVYSELNISTEVGASYLLPSETNQFKNIGVKLRQYVSTSDYFDGTTLNNQQKLQQIIDDIVSNNETKGKRELVVDSRLNFNGSITLPSNFKMIFEENGIIMPQNDQTRIINNQNSLPTTTYPLNTDAVGGDDRLDMGVNSAAFTVGDYIILRDTAIIDTSPNFNQLVQAQTAIIVAKDGNDIILDNPMEYNFSAATTNVGIIVGQRNIELIGFNTGEIDTQIGNDGADFRYIDNLVIKDFTARNSRLAVNPDGAFNRTNVHGLSVLGCSNVNIQRIQGESIGYYLLNIDGCCRNVVVRDLTCSIARHGVSINWNGVGETLNCLVENVVTTNLQRGGIDTHDVGRDITFRKVKSRYCIEDGGQIRTSSVLVEDYTAEFCGNNGFLVYVTPDNPNPNAGQRLDNIEVRNIRCNNNGKRGIASVVALNIDGVRCRENGDTFNLTDHGGISLNGGYVKNAVLTQNNGPAITYRDPAALSGIDTLALKRSLTLDRAIAPYDASSQTHFLYSPDTYQDYNVRLREVNATGYSTANLISRAGSTFIADIDDRGCRWSSDPTRGSVVLSSGSATVLNGNVKDDGVYLNRKWYSRIAVFRLDAGAGGVGTVYVSSVVDGVSFTITSTDGTDAGRIGWYFV